MDLSTYHPSQRRYVQLKIEASIRRTVIILDLTGTRIDIALSRGFWLHLAAMVVHIEHLIVGRSKIVTVIHSTDYGILNMKICYNIEFD
jgi:hypothetical protein